MRGQLVTVCMFCLLCASHTTCSAHQEPSPLEMGSKGTVEDASDTSTIKQERRVWDDQMYIQKMFHKFGDGQTLSLSGLKQLLKAVKLDQLIHPPTEHPNSQSLNKTQSQPTNCVNINELVEELSGPNNNKSHKIITSSTYHRLCPLLLYQLTEPQRCITRSGAVSENDPSFLHSDEEAEEIEPANTTLVWLYSTLSIIVISLCGLLGVAVIPVMQRVFYQQLLQFLVALAVGTLCGDALLHLLPHAMMGGSEGHHSHHHTHSHDSTHDSHDPHTENMWKGLVTSLGVVFFFFTEKCLTMCAEWRKRRQKMMSVPRVRVMRDTDDMNNSTVGEKLCKHKYSSYPLCYKDITKDDAVPENSNSGRKNGGSPPCHRSSSSDPLPTAPLADQADSDLVSNKEGSGDVKEFQSQPLARPDMDFNIKDKDYTIIIREHQNHHHGHSHTHGHVHSAPNSLSSVAWMVVMGDGLHNFTDGMTIGAAFAASIAGGFSTAVAVFCHELPHELGDFAVLLKAGMSARQAVFYNLLSSVLCFFGMCLGISLGNTESASQWIFSIAAGMFLYIALVDMIPELTSSHSMEGGSVCQCFLQLIGLMTGIGIMLLIANYEHELKHSFSD